ncbi:MAG: hypothetical protein HY659_12260 [Rhizobiales bacterium]|nr:hypothetical protein [Hyphomicrobiales bacterium]
MKLSWLIATTAVVTLAGATAANAQSPFQWQLPASGFSNSAIVIEGGQIVGQDPDLFVRSQILRDNPLRSGGNS